MGAACSQPDNIHRDDIIIPIVGRPGAGKSTFINAAVGRDVSSIQHDSKNALYVKCSSPESDRRNIVFVEITLSELDLSGGRMIEELNHWLTRISLQGLKLPGILYLHRITDVEPIGVFTYLTSLRSRKEFSQLLSATQLMIVTTMWGELQSPSIGVEREKKLERYLAGLETPQQDCVLRTIRFADTFESAWLTIYACVENPGSLQLQPDHSQPNTFSAARMLISRIMEDTLQKAYIAELEGEDAQCMVDFLNIVLHEHDILDTDEGKSLLRLLRKLAKSAQVFPQCYELKGVQCDFSRPQEGGGFADVFKGEYENQMICVKAVRIFREQENAQMLKAHVKELVLWAHLSHQNILPFYGAFLFGKEPQRLCLVSPWMHNGDLSIFLKNFPQAPRVPLISDTIAGLQYLHRYNIVHGDLKAKNILVSDDGRALITDFGISRIIMTTRLASTRLSNGTMRWTAPELLADDGDDFSPPTPESDIWSFGCLCYEIRTCKVPFYHYSTDYRLLSALQRGKEIPIRPAPEDQFDGIDDCIWDLMRRCWDYVPSNRPVCEEIQKCVAGMGIPDNRPRTSLQAPRTSAFWEDIRNKSETTIDYERVHRILLGVHWNQSGTRAVDLTACRDLSLTMGILNGPEYRSTSPYSVQSSSEGHQVAQVIPPLESTRGRMESQQVPPNSVSNRTSTYTASPRLEVAQSFENTTSRPPNWGTKPLPQASCLPAPPSKPLSPPRPVMTGDHPGDTQVPPKINAPDGDGGLGEPGFNAVPTTPVSSGASVANPDPFEPTLEALYRGSTLDLQPQQWHAVDQRSATATGQSSSFAPKQEFEFTFPSQVAHSHDNATASVGTAITSLLHLGQARRDSTVENHSDLLLMPSRTPRKLDTACELPTWDHFYTEQQQRQLGGLSGNTTIDEQTVNMNDVLPGAQQPQPQLNPAFTFGQKSNNNFLYVGSGMPGAGLLGVDGYGLPQQQAGYGPDYSLSGTSTPSSTGASAYHTPGQWPSPTLLPMVDAAVPNPTVTTGRTANASRKRRKQEASFVCPIPGCGMTFMRSFNLKGHIRSHKEEKPFVCQWPGCGKGFARQHDLERHEQLHTNFRPFSCDGCGKQFARMDALNRHLRSEGGADCLTLQEANRGVSQSENGGVKGEKAEEGNVGVGGVTKDEKMD